MNASIRRLASFPVISAGFAAALSLFAAVPSFAQQSNVPLQLRGYSKAIPWHAATNGTTNNEAAAPTNGTASSGTIPLWQFSVTSPVDGNTYTGQMVGRSPFFHGARTTNIPTFIIPLKLTMTGPNGVGTATFDPTANHTCAPAGVPLTLFQNSPIFQNASFSFGGTNVGTGQYVDVFQRANFWTNVNVTGSRYHTVLGPVTTHAVVAVSVPPAFGQAYSPSQTGGCGNLGVVDINWLQPYLENTLIPSLSGAGVGPTTFPIFLLSNVVMGDPGTSLSPNTCCVLGYHTALGSPMQTYSPIDFDTTGAFSGVSDTSVAAHEVGEWMDDPDASNPTPGWGNVGQVSGCQYNLEVGDPLSCNQTTCPQTITKKMPNNVTYNLQELAFYSWFFRQNPSLGVNGWFSDNGTFTTDAGPVC